MKFALIELCPYNKPIEKKINKFNYNNKNIKTIKNLTSVDL